MPKIQCKMCGGMVELTGQTVAECPYCGSTTTFPKIDTERREQLYARAEHFRHLNDFDRAFALYETLVKEDGTDAEAYWGMVLCRFGIEYVEDPGTHERIPTCNRLQYDSILADADYLSALENADSYERDVYEREGKRIAELQKRILLISSQEKPYDVFICYKEKSEGGTRTKDSTLAQDIYYQLTNEGYKVFFARITLEDKLGINYEPYIFAALNSSRVMLVVGTCREYFDAVWVKNEWRRFLKLMKEDSSRLLIPCYQGMDPYDLPEELAMFQSQDMSKIGFLQDLVRGVKKVLDAAKESKKASRENVDSPTVANLLKRVVIFLKNKDFDSAKTYCERVLDLDAECSQAYLYSLLAERKMVTREELCNYPKKLSDDPLFKLAWEYADDRQKASLNKLLSEQIARKRKQLDEIVQRLKTKALNIAPKNLFELMHQFMRAADDPYITPELKAECNAYSGECSRQLNQLYINAKNYMRLHDYATAQAILTQIVDFSNSKQLLEECKAEAAKIKAEQDKKESLLGCASIILLSMVIGFVFFSC